MGLERKNWNNLHFTSIIPSLYSVHYNIFAIFTTICSNPEDAIQMGSVIEIRKIFFKYKNKIYII